MKQGVRESTIALLTVLLICFQPAYANGSHVHLGGIFFLLLGGLVFIGGLGVVFYLLFRQGPGETHDKGGDE